MQTPKKEDKIVVKGPRPKAKRTSAAELRKEIDALKATNMRLLKDLGNLSAMYMNALSQKRTTEIAQDKEAVVMATKRVIAFLMTTYGFSMNNLVH